MRSHMNERFADAFFWCRENNVTIRFDKREVSLSVGQEDSGMVFHNRSFLDAIEEAKLWAPLGKLSGIGL